MTVLVHQAEDPRPLTRAEFDQLGRKLQLTRFGKSFKSLEWQDTGE
jgi:hypothetical protein